MKSNYLENLLDCDNQMNHKVLNLLRGLSSINENSKNIFAHLLTAKKVWIKRLQSEDWTNISIWPTLSMDECGALIADALHYGELFCNSCYFKQHFSYIHTNQCAA